MDADTRFLFLRNFPPLKNVTAQLYTKRRDFIPANPVNMTDLNIDLSMFLYSEDGENVVKGDTVLSDGRRIILFSSNKHLEVLARARQILGDGTFKITPSLWCQTFII